MIPIREYERKAHLEWAIFRFSLIFVVLLLNEVYATMGSPETPSERDSMLESVCTESDEFAPLPKPQPDDWLSQHHEPGQTFEEFVSLHPNRPDSSRRKICLQPLDHFTPGRSPSLRRLREFMQAFFCMEVETLAVLPSSEQSFTTRINPYTKNEQLKTGDILTTLRRTLPDEAFCIVGITMHDLYPSPAWNFVFGQASYTERVGVFSFARYDPAFYGDVRGEDFEPLVLIRACKVLAHETCHMFGMHHCIDYACLMNGSNHLAESDSRPLHLCPVCLRKLHHSIHFNPIDRLKALHEFYLKVGFRGAALWLENRLQHISR